MRNWVRAQFRASFQRLTYFGLTPCQQASPNDPKANLRGSCRRLWAVVGPKSCPSSLFVPFFCRHSSHHISASLPNPSRVITHILCATAGALAATPDLPYNVFVKIYENPVVFMNEILWSFGSPEMKYLGFFLKVLDLKMYFFFNRRILWRTFCKVILSCEIDINIPYRNLVLYRHT